MAATWYGVHLGSWSCAFGKPLLIDQGLTSGNIDIHPKASHKTRKSKFSSLRTVYGIYGWFKSQKDLNFAGFLTCPATAEVALDRV